MAISVFDLFKIGIGPSSSHTVGPMRAAALFVNGLATHQLLEQVAAIKSELFGSLGATGRGHGTDSAVLLGLEGEQPDSIAIDTVTPRVAAIRADGLLHLLGRHPIVFREKEHLLFYRRETLAFHSNGMRFTATGNDGAVLACKTYYSVGGGFVVDEQAVGKQRIAAETSVLPHPFHSGDELLALCHERGCSISQLMLDNEQVWRDEATIRRELLHIWEVMQQCVQRGAQQEGILPGGLHVKRRAAALYRKLCALPSDSLADPLATLDWIGFYALAVNEENASGGRVVTAPTNGAAGIIPAVLHYYLRFIPGANEDGVVRFLLTAAAIGLLYKENASISGAEVGCQGEVGVACSMAAAGLAEVLGGSVAQVENAAEIGMEHNLGLTCDPIGGLVQVPCIERNAMGAVKAVNAARMALNGDGHHHVSLDKVIRTMRQTGADMKTKYKETSRGGLAVNIIEC
ncbi:L-serine ammonia-lyase [Herbaspirillum sp. RTI4]|uniref:L-serine ammonia-lyase n=1 Tax=Herbaspirillum sp. RTI4 TaxID=3048640 RepID=UPI002AB3EF41|nr:L-serine ammonia-lyase [Herbaspirillum sp. RTI4]MDY7579115.1 L-serine ammonia-lyase [Herbaspirillum sp. RTI4]MEA9981306.1 L-serine ammonia-lyase [Herbaspirillum sp. RTI4]